MQKVELAPYIFFSGNCAEAFEFYKKVLAILKDEPYLENIHEQN